MVPPYPCKTISSSLFRRSRANFGINCCVNGLWGNYLFGKKTASRAMNWNHQPMPFGEAIITTLLYLVIVGVFYLAVALAVAAPFCLLRHRFALRFALNAFWRVLAFFGILLGVGAVAQYLWTTAIWGRFYHSTDYVYGYMPFLPLTQKTINFEFAGERGALNGISLTTLNLIWLTFTIPVWAATIQIYRRLVRDTATPPDAKVYLSPA